MTKQRNARHYLFSLINAAYSLKPGKTSGLGPWPAWTTCRHAQTDLAFPHFLARACRRRFQRRHHPLAENAAASGTTLCPNGFSGDHLAGKNSFGIDREASARRNSAFPKNHRKTASDAVRLTAIRPGTILFRTFRKSPQRTFPGLGRGFFGVLFASRGEFSYAVILPRRIFHRKQPMPQKRRIPIVGETHPPAKKKNPVAYNREGLILVLTNSSKGLQTSYQRDLQGSQKEKNAFLR